MGSINNMVENIDKRVRLTCVDIGMLLHIRFLVEALAAVLTRVRSGVGMDQQVRREGTRPFERFAALLTLENTHHLH